MEEPGGVPPANFATLKLLSAPGYREAYRSILILTLGLRLIGGPVRLSLKDISALYEYWCYLKIVQTVAEFADSQVPLSQLIRPDHNGLRILLQKGRETVVKFVLSTGRQ